MRLDQELVARGLCESRTEAQELIEDGSVLVDGEVARKQTRQITEANTLEVLARRKFVSRGGEKLEGVFFDSTHSGSDEGIRKMIEGKVALDVGSSTGGFTDCLLRYGAAHVDAVDVGTEQLHQKLRTDPQVRVYENTDIRTFASATLYDIIVADLSFIPLESVLHLIVRFGKGGTHFFLLLKPQFEVGRGNTKKGIVKDMDKVQDILKKYTALAEEQGLHDMHVLPSRIKGGDGNQEYFLFGKL